MTRNGIIDFLYNQSTSKDKVLFELLKDENFNIPQFKAEKNTCKNELEDNAIIALYTDPQDGVAIENKKPQFKNLSTCSKCRYWNKKIRGCISQVAITKGCGHPEYKYFEER